MPEPTTPLRERPWEDVARMLDVDRALARVVEAFTSLPEVDQPLTEVYGQVLSIDVVARDNVPPFRNSAMDGFAVRSSDTARASWKAPVTLRVIGHAAAGQGEIQFVGSGEAVRIMTGAPLPDGADAVVRFEETDEPANAEAATLGRVKIFRTAKALDNVREAGEDIGKGRMVLCMGRQLGPAEVGLLASVGVGSAPVHRRPVVAVLSTGNELVAPERELSPGMIRDSNAYVLAGMARAWGASVRMLGIARDTVGDVTEKLAVARGADLIVTSGGVSLGDYDLVKDVLKAEGDVAIWQVRMKPGKPLAFGHVGGTPLLGLPGNPVAAAVSFLLFGRPAIRRMLGFRDIEPRTIEAISAEAIDNRGQRRHYVRVALEEQGGGPPLARPVGEQGAGVLSSLAAADALLVAPEELERVEPGMRLAAIPLDWHGMGALGSD
jgi:molybdopterin molybdotransferase